MKNSTYEPYRNFPFLAPKSDYYVRLYKALAESGAEEYTDHLPREESYEDDQIENVFDKVEPIYSRQQREESHDMCKSMGKEEPAVIDADYWVLN